MEYRQTSTAEHLFLPKECLLEKSWEYLGTDGFAAIKAAPDWESSAAFVAASDRFAGCARQRVLMFYKMALLVVLALTAVVMLVGGLSAVGSMVAGLARFMASNLLLTGALGGTLAGYYWFAGWSARRDLAATAMRMRTFDSYDRYVEEQVRYSASVLGRPAAPSASSGLMTGVGMGIGAKVAESAIASFAEKSTAEL